jgi:signal transduction histidine kinase/ActR/RegA family two-component response regulator
MNIDQERLLETILNLEHARRLERRLRLESDALLRGLQSINEAKEPDQLFSNIVTVLRDIFEFQDAVILQMQESGQMVPLVSTSSVFSGIIWRPQMLFGRVLSGQPSAVFDVAMIPEWQEVLPVIGSTVSSALHVAISDGLRGAMLICTHPEPQHFGPSHVKQAHRLSFFASQSLMTLINVIKLQQARQDLLKHQKLESLGLLAGGIAHDFNNILAVMLGSISLARKQLHNPEKLEQRLKAAQVASIRAQALTQQLLTFAKGGEPIKKTMQLNDILKEASDFALHGTAVKSSYAFDSQLWLVEADEGQLSQVIHNLIINAVQAMPDGGTVKIGTENLDTGESGLKMVRAYVEDSGCGVSEENLSRIFDPFFTTKKKGSGLGLATSYSIIKKHGGEITVSSSPGKGSIFSILLPASGGKVAEKLQDASTLFHGEGRVLVMDDEVALLETIKEMLEELGYRVECAANGTDAVELYRQSQEEGEPFDLVILDLTIPGEMGGKETISILRTLNPDVVAVVSSGYSKTAVLSNFRDYGFSAMIHKPYELNELSQILSDLTIKKT